ncbi:hypothetical protein [Alkalihalobacillus pseudalcaliphilus]|uniref:hypothetical protein n=1 Tax=Alkalihalobacillus pseudalcaliphilus TaxID=79884 RepID=UPI00064D9B6C|nr:hypothetical protein [Alkalihalobacillus pseudalcaliphilus]KMK77313.1 hypothetical protein AB990_07140 [Alkalihalobacillus pseudalcaliphilus]
MSKTPFTSFKDKEIQYKQKLLHYRSEINKLSTDTKKMEASLREKDETIQALKEKIAQLSNENLHTEPLSAPEQLLINSYFSYSIMIPKDDDTITLKGHFIVKNTGTNPLHNPIICLVFNQPKYSNLTGKISHPKQRDLNVYLMDDNLIVQSWSFVENQSRKEAKKSGHYWLQPNDLEVLKPNETISFSDFEIEILKGHELPNFVVDGFIYGQEIQDGMQANNQIICNIF